MTSRRGLSTFTADGSRDVGTLTKSEYEEARGETDVQVVLPQPRMKGAGE